MENLSYLPISNNAASSPCLSFEGLRNFRMITYSKNSWNQRFSPVTDYRDLVITRAPFSQSIYKMYLPSFP